MRMLILAASTAPGFGESLPPALLDVAGATLLDRQITSAVDASLASDVVVITGHRHAQIEHALAAKRRAVTVTTLFNPFHENTGSLVSLWCARHLLTEQDFMITDADILYRNAVLARAAYASATQGLALAVMDDDACDVSQDAQGRVLCVGAETAGNARAAGLAFVRGEPARRIFANALERSLRDLRNHSASWLKVFDELARAGARVNGVRIARSDCVKAEYRADAKTLRTMLAAKAGLVMQQGAPNPPNQR